MAVAWTLSCDRPGCRVQIEARAPYDQLAQRRALEKARDAGWQLARTEDVPLDFCPSHKEPE